MHKPLFFAAFALLLAGCTSTADPSLRPFDVGPDLQPIPGSITYGGQPRTKLTKSPIGSSLGHEFFNQQGDRVIERYVIQPDRSLNIVSRRIVRLPFGFDD